MVQNAGNPWYPKLRELYYREPFVPFEIRTRRGKRVLVKDPIRIMFAPALPTIHVATGPGEKTEYIPVADVIDIVEKGRKPRRRAR